MFFVVHPRSRSNNLLCALDEAETQFLYLFNGDE